jgi:hypothetical protein
MTARLVKPAISLVTVGAVILAAMAVYFSFGAGSADADSVYTPEFHTHYCNSMDTAFPDVDLAGAGFNPVTYAPNCSENKTAGASTNTTTILDHDNVDMNFSSVVTFSPPGGTITDGSTIASGTKIGGLRSLTNLGLLNATCTTALVVDFILYNVELPDNPSNPRASGNLMYPLPDGTANRFSQWQEDSEPAPGAPTVNDANSDLRADSDEEAINGYPKYLLDVFDPDFVNVGNTGAANPIVPKAVYGGLTNVANTWVPLYFAQFDPGQLTAMPGAMSEFVSTMGAPNVSVLNDPSAVVISPSSITDFCTPLNVTTVLLGDPAGPGVRMTTPGAGTAIGVQYNASQRDTDQDGLENQVDTCVGNVNTGGDTDADGIDNACDSGGGGSDQDGDGFQNRQDNCPQVANGGVAQTDSEVTVVPNDYGPRLDGIGDICDTGTVNATVNNRPVTFTLASNVANGRYHATLKYDATCFGATPAGGTDADGDGHCTTSDNQDSGACTTTSNAPLPGTTNTCPVRHTAWSAANAPAIMTGIDTDNDTFLDGQEQYLGTETTKACQQNPQYPTVSGGANNEAPLDNWPMDFNDDQISNTTDVGQFVARLNRAVNMQGSGGQAPTARHDLNFDGIVNTTDVGKFVAVLNRRCDQPTGVGTPPGMGFPSYNTQQQ